MKLIGDKSQFNIKFYNIHYTVAKFFVSLLLGHLTSIYGNN